MLTMLSPSDHLRAIASISTHTIKSSALLQAPSLEDHHHHIEQKNCHDSSTSSSSTAVGAPQQQHTVIRGEQIDAYTMDAVNAVRNNDLPRLRELLQQGHCLDACNANGESLFHLACRRGHAATVQFFVSEAAVNVDWRDCLGRSALHDLCWRPAPALDVMDVVLPAVLPQLWWAVDARGHSCWDYCRRSDWEIWNHYLTQRQDVIAQTILQQQQKTEMESKTV